MNLSEKNVGRRSLVTVSLWLVLVAMAACRTPTVASSGTTQGSSASQRQHAVAAPPDLVAELSATNSALQKAWKNAGVVPAAPVGDLGYLRRCYLDLTGVVPPHQEVQAFLSDRRPDKRHRLVSRLSQTPAHFAHMANTWDGILLGKVKRNPWVDRVAFRRWLYQSFKSNMPWDRLVRQLVSATGQNSAGGRPKPSDWGALERVADAGVPINGAVNFSLSHFRQPQNLAGATSRIFLGIQIQCAECHDHKTERWTQAEFKHFTAAFMRTRLHRIDRGRVMGKRRAQLKDVDGNPRWLARRNQRLGYSAEQPRALDGTDLGNGPRSPRQALAQWLTAKSNPWFAQAYVNRVWAQLLGTGFMNPVDDIREGQKVIVPQVLRQLSQAFVRRGYDTRWLYRVIMASDAYGRSSGAEGKVWSSFRMRSMSSDQLLDSIARAGGIGAGVERLTGERLSRVKLNLRHQFRFLFDVDEEGDAEVFSGTIPQSLLMQNGVITTAASSRFEGTTLAQAMDMPDADAIRFLYESVYGRPPRATESQHWQRFLKGATGGYVVSVEPGAVRSGAGRKLMARAYRRVLRKMSPRDHALEDLMWALLNSSEFFFIH